jgi:hypothetical protein
MEQDNQKNADPSKTVDDGVIARGAVKDIIE